jgi:hypothetical protein
MSARQVKRYLPRIKSREEKRVQSQLAWTLRAAESQGPTGVSVPKAEEAPLPQPAKEDELNPLL